jgi:type I restriction enzyme S subunit
VNLQTFHDNFELLAEAPNGVPELRELILQLAIQGKLLNQNPEESSTDLLQGIRYCRKQQNLKPLPRISPNELPFALPTNWTWLRIGEAMNLINGKAFKPTDWSQQGLPIVRIQNLNNPAAPFNYCDSDVDEKFLIKDDEFLISWSGTPGTSFGAFIWNRGKAVLNQHIFRGDLIGKGYQKEFLKYAINGRLDEMIAKAHGGVGLRHITKGKLEMMCIPLPPLEEQKRIVAKVDQMMKLCDELEERQQKKREARVRFNESALEHLLIASTPKDFNKHWRRICDSFELLYDTPETIGKLRQAILQLAVQGKLVKQDSNDEPSVLLHKRIEAEKEPMLKVGKVAIGDELSPVEPEQAPFDLPEGWSWARFPKLGEFSRGKSKHRPRNDPSLFEGGKYKLVQTGDVARANGVITTYTSLYNDVGLAQSRMWPKGTLCITIAANIADSSLLGFDACFPDSVVGFIPSKEIGDAKYFEFFIRTVKENLMNFAPSTAQKNINLGILEKVLIPLPPKEEMKRIVAKVDQLMKLCDELEAKLKQAQALSSDITTSMVNHLFSSTDKDISAALSV